MPKSKKGKPYTPLPSKDFLDQCFDYRPLTGEIYWKWRPADHFERWPKPEGHAARFNSNFAGRLAGTWMKVRRARYLIIQISSLGTNGLLGHRIIWRMMTGDDPGFLQVDHKDQNSMNNKWENLRLADNRQNNSNRISGRKRKPGSESLPRGVYLSGKKFTAHVTKDGKQYRLGTFATIEEAHAARVKVFTEVAGEFACH